MIKSNCDSLHGKIYPTQIVIVETTVCDDYIIGGDLTVCDDEHNEENEDNEIKYVISDVADVDFSITEDGYLFYSIILSTGNYIYF